MDDHKNKTLEEQERDLTVASLNAEQMLFGNGEPMVVKEVIEKFALLVYDMPSTEVGNKARTELLEQARWAGAVQHTESVYLLPWSDLIDMAVLKAADAGKVYVWISVPKDPDVAKQITIDYDKKVQEIFKECEERFDNIAKHIEEGRWGIAHRMIEKTTEQVASLKKVAVTRGSARLYARWEEMSQKLEIHHQLFKVTGKYE